MPHETLPTQPCFLPFRNGKWDSGSKKKSSLDDKPLSKEEKIPKPAPKPEQPVEAGKSETQEIQKSKQESEKETPDIPKNIISPVEETHEVKKETPSLFRKRQTQATDQEKKPEEKKKNDFTEDQLAAAWKSYVDEKMEAGVGESEKLILTRSISKKSDQIVCIQLKSDLEANILDRFEADLVQHFRSKLENDVIKLEKEIVKGEEKQKLYTSSDKYNYLVEKNPKLKDLKDRLGLDYEF